MERRRAGPTDARLAPAAATDVPRALTPLPSPTPLIYPAGALGYAISWPQCGGPYPGAPFDFGIVGVTDGAALTHNPCFASEWRWALAGADPPAVYWNVNYDECGPNDPACDPYAYGQREAQDAYDYATSQGAHPSTWWLDVQTVSSWSADPARNAQAIAGALAFFRARNLRSAISSTSYQFGTVAGSMVPGLTSWVAGRADKDYARRFCETGDSFAGRGTELTAYVADGFETVLACGPQ